MFIALLPSRGTSVRRAARSRSRRRPYRSLIEHLEDRCLLATFNVNSLADIAVPPTGVVTLRSAISAANNTPGGNTINLTLPGTYQITIPGVNENSNQTGDFDILPSGGNLTISNTSGGAATVSGGGLDRVFDINPNNSFNPAAATAKFTVTMQGFTITDGLAFSPLFTDGTGALGSGNNPSDVSGGAIRDSFNASLTLQNMVVSGNTAQAAGGGISMENPLGFSTPWTLTVQNSTISNNRAGDAGGGINTKGSGRVVVTQSVISGNVCPNQGAGIWLDTVDVGGGHQSALLKVFQSVISGNVGTAAGSFGGGIGNAGDNTFRDLTGAIANLPTDFPGTLILDSTISNNSTGGQGGGYGDENGLGFLEVHESTFAYNSAIAGGGIQVNGPNTRIFNTTITGNAAQSNGGGLLIQAGNVVLDNSVVAQNYSGGTNFLPVAGPDVFGTVTIGFGDFIGTSDANLTGLVNNPTLANQVGTAAAPLHPLLGPLQNNGGPLAGATALAAVVPTLAPLPGSPLIDKGFNAAVVDATDQRGLPRIINNVVDIGAVEFQPPATTLTLTASTTTPKINQQVTLTAKVAAVTPGAPVTGTVTFTVDGVALPNGTVALVNGVATYTFTVLPKMFTKGAHNFTATYSGDTNFTPSTQTVTLTLPGLPVLTTSVTKKRGKFTVQVFADGQPVTGGTFVLRSTPIIQMRDFNNDGINDLVINVRKNRKTLTVVAVFSGADASRIA